MRILRLYLHNLNSLAGRWCIDFTDPEYTAAGIFAITGPTGAGKSTILDGICLALYGRTPRLERISKRRNEIMSRRRGECMAEVEFETADGRYRCHWSQHRARRRPDGELQPPRHELADAETGHLLETRRRDVLRRVEEITGMDFHRFTRSMLLAQGGFAAFLQAAPDERAPILEQITGTGVYSRISILVHERLSAERAVREQLEEELGGVRLLSAEAEEGLRAELEGLEKRATGLQAGLERLDRELRWLERLEGLEAELRQTGEKLHELAGRRQAAATDLRRLERARRAAGLEGIHVELTLLRQRQADEQGELVTGQQRARELAVRRQEQAGRLQEAQEGLHRTRERLAREREVIRRVRALDVRIGEQERRREALAAELRELEKAAAAQDRELGAMGRRLEKIRAGLREKKAYLAAHGEDGLLVEKLEGIRRMLLDLATRRSRLDDLAAAAGEAEQALQTAAERLQQRQAALTGARSRADACRLGVGELEERLAGLLGERRIAALHREAEILAARLSRLDDALELLAQRQRLREGQRQQAGTLAGITREKEELSVATAGMEERMVAQKKLLNSLQENRLLQRKILDLEEERRYLVVGRPCPLCGSTSHPWAGATPVVEEEGALAREQAIFDRMAEEVGRNRVRLAGLDKDAARLEEKQREAAATLEEIGSRLAELAAGVQVAPEVGPLAAAREEVATALDTFRQRLEEAEALQERLEKARRAHEAANGEMVRVEKALQEARHARDTAAAEVRRLAGERKRTEDDLASARQETLGAVRPFVACDRLPDQSGPLLTELEERLQSWKDARYLLEGLERELVELRARRTAAREQLEQGRQAEVRQREKVDRADRELASLREQRTSLYGARVPEVEEERLAAAVQAAEQRQANEAMVLATLEQELRSLAARLAGLHGRTEERAVRLADQEALLQRRLGEAGFANEEEFVAARLDEAAMHTLAELAETLDRQEATLQARARELRSTLATERQKAYTTEPGQEVVRQRQALQEEQQETQQRIGAIRATLEDNRRLARERRRLLRRLRAQQRECARWQRLHELIGSADGKKFRVFAQGLTLDLVIGHANRQLRKMQDRYLLVRHRDLSLELDVIDNYQAGEIRSTRNLSGGESFIVSLALALGLSAMASRRVRVESLFLDEGFGTLDEEALDTALQTLAELQQDGRLIGIISHVPALRERIATRIRVIPGPGGHSRLEGPGCSRVRADDLRT